MKRKLLLAVAFLGVLGTGLLLSGCAKNNGTVFSKAWATKELNKTLAEENVVIGKGFFKYYIVHYISKNDMTRYLNYIAKLAVDGPKIENEFIGKPAGYFTGHVDICRPEYGTSFGRKIYGCSYTMVFHPSKDYKKLINIETYSGKLKLPADRPQYIYQTYTTKHAGIAFKKDKKKGIWKPVAFNFNPYGSPSYK